MELFKDFAENILCLNAMKNPSDSFSKIDEEIGEEDFLLAGNSKKLKPVFLFFGIPFIRKYAAKWV